MKKTTVCLLLLLPSLAAAGQLQKYPSLYHHHNYSSICDSMQINGDDDGRIVCGWYQSVLGRGGEPHGILYWRGRLARRGEPIANTYNAFLRAAEAEISGASIPAY